MIDKSNDTIKIKLFKPGSEAIYNGWPYIIENVILKHGDVYVNLLNCIDNPVHQDKLITEPVTIKLKRT